MKRIPESIHSIVDDNGDIRHPDDIGYFDAVGTTPRHADYSRDEAAVTDRDRAYEDDGLDAMLHLEAERDAVDHGLRTIQIAPVEARITTPEGVSVNLGERAVYLLQSLENYSAYNSRRSFIHKLESRLRASNLDPKERASIVRSIAKATANMREFESKAHAAFDVGYGLNAMAERPEQLTGDNGFPMSKQDVADLGVQARRAFRTEFTAFDIHDDHEGDPNDQLYDIGQKREAFRKTLGRQLPPNDYR
jgi:hypothetical protein